MQVIKPVKAKNLPDTPASAHILDTRCEDVKLRLSWGSAIQDQPVATLPGPWVPMDDGSDGANMSVRNLKVKAHGTKGAAIPAQMLRLYNVQCVIQGLAGSRV